MKNILLEEKEVLDYIKEMLNSFKMNKTDIEEDLFHHNTKYQYGISVLKNGILSLNDLNRLGINDYSNELLELMSDSESHVNGTNGISLSKVGLTDLYRDEDEYNPFSNTMLDILIDKNIKAPRNTIHYGNEFICENIIELDKFKSIDIRLLKYIENTESINSLQDIKEIMNDYNDLIVISSLMKNMKLPLREMSNEAFDIDINKLSNTEKIIIKK